MDWLYGFYVRKDIAEKVGVDPQSVVTKEDFYNFLKNQGCQSAGERPAGLSSGGFSNGWAVGIGNTMFYSGASYVDKGDGTVEHNFFTKGYEEYTLFYRKLVEEGLMDPEAFTQTDPIAKEKSIKAALPSWLRTIRPSWMLPRSMSLRIRAATTFLSARWSALTLSRTGLLIWGFREIT